MPCIKVDLPGGGFALARVSSDRVKSCKYCGRISSKLCDFKLTGSKAGKTCDAPMCEKCAHYVEPDKDYCKPHWAIIETRRRQAAMEFDAVNPPKGSESDGR